MMLKLPVPDYPLLYLILLHTGQQLGQFQSGNRLPLCLKKAARTRQSLYYSSKIDAAGTALSMSSTHQLDCLMASSKGIESRAPSPLTSQELPHTKKLAIDIPAAAMIC
jgi:hypothetical protein